LVAAKDELLTRLNKQVGMDGARQGEQRQQQGQQESQRRKAAGSGEMEAIFHELLIFKLMKKQVMPEMILAGFFFTQVQRVN